MPKDDLFDAYLSGVVGGLLANPNITHLTMGSFLSPTPQEIIELAKPVVTLMLKARREAEAAAEADWKDARVPSRIGESREDAKIRQKHLASQKATLPLWCTCELRDRQWNLNTHKCETCGGLIPQTFKS